MRRKKGGREGQDTGKWSTGEVNRRNRTEKGRIHSHQLTDHITFVSLNPKHVTVQTTAPDSVEIEVESARLIRTDHQRHVMPPGAEGRVWRGRNRKRSEKKGRKRCKEGGPGGEGRGPGEMTGNAQQIFRLVTSTSRSRGSLFSESM